MAQVVSRCPLTGHYMFVGIDIGADDFAKLPETFARKFCPFCSCEHAWHKSTSRLVDRRPPISSNVQRAS
jgi:hypothetical protein